MGIRSWVSIITILGCGTVSAQTPPAAPAPVVAPVVAATPPPAVGAPAVPAPCANPKLLLQNVKVSKVMSVPLGQQEAAPQNGTPKEKVLVQLGQGIGIKVDGLNNLLQYQQCLGKDIVLFLDGRALTDLSPYPRSDPDKSILFFELKRREESRPIWTYLLGKPGLGPRRVQASVGLADGYAVPSSNENDTSFLLDVMPARRLWGWSAVVLFLLIGGLLLARNSDMLRESGPVPPGGERKAYSLSRVQLATWTFLVLTSYLFIGLVTGDYTTSITDSVLALMGISAGTAIGSSIIDSNRSLTPVPATTVVAPAVVVQPAAGGQAAAADPPVPAGQPGAVAGNVPAVAVTQQLPALLVVQPAPRTTGKWWLDILTDQDGVNFHRFQMAAWTLVLGIVFLRQVYNELAMPEFSPSLLMLIGISSGTYLGLKVTSENPARR